MPCHHWRIGWGGGGGGRTHKVLKLGKRQKRLLRSSMPITHTDLLGMWTSTNSQEQKMIRTRTSRDDSCLETQDVYTEEIQKANVFTVEKFASKRLHKSQVTTTPMSRKEECPPTCLPRHQPLLSPRWYYYGMATYLRQNRVIACCAVEYIL